MTPERHDDDGWNEWSRHVLAELTRLNGCYERLAEQVESLRVSLGMLEVKSGLWGAAAGTIPSAIAVILMVLLK